MQVASFDQFASPQLRSPTIISLFIQVERARTKIEPLKQLIDAVEEDIKESEHDERVKLEIKEATENVIAQVKNMVTSE